MGVHLGWKKIFNNFRTAGNFSWILGSVKQFFLDTFWHPKDWNLRYFYAIIVFYALWLPNFLPDSICAWYWFITLRLRQIYVLTIFYRLFIVPVKTADVNKMVNIFSIFIHYFTDDSLKLLCTKITVNWTSIKKNEKKMWMLLFLNEFARIKSYLCLYL